MILIKINSWIYKFNLKT